jgi:cystathionine beta-lyase
VEEATAAIEGLKYSSGSATYLAWIDATELATDSPHQYFLDRKVGMADGADFGRQKFLRLNFACPEAMLTEALERMAS